MDNKELPQEIVEDLKEHYSAGIVPHQAYKGAQITHSHYLKELQAKDTTIKEQAEKINKLTGLLKMQVFERTYIKYANTDIGHDECERYANEAVERYFKEQHGI